MGRGKICTTPGKMSTGPIITARRTHTHKPEEPPDFDLHHVDVKEILSKESSERLKWLSAALRAAAEDRIKPSLTALFDILAHRKFSENIGTKTGRRMRREILDHSDLFSSKQRKHLLSSQWCLSQFASSHELAELEEEHAADKEDPGTPPPSPPPLPQSSVSSTAVATSASVPAFPQALPTRLADPTLSSSIATSSSSASAHWATSTTTSTIASLAAAAPVATKVMRGRPMGFKPSLAAVFGQDEDDDEAAGAERTRLELEAAARKRREATSAVQRPGDNGLSRSSEVTILNTSDSRRSNGRHHRSSRSRSRSPKHSGGGFMLGSGSVAFRRRKASDKNPHHDSLEDIRAQVLKERGISGSRKSHR